jgi:hypothetical protein
MVGIACYGGFEDWLVSLSNGSATARGFRFGNGGFEDLSHRTGISLRLRWLRELVSELVELLSHREGISLRLRWLREPQPPQRNFVWK